MNFIRGDKLIALDFSGPQGSAVYHEVEYDIIVRLNAFNAWIDMSNALNPQPWAQQQHCTWICFTRYQRELILRWNAKHDQWELDGLTRPGKSGGGCAPPPAGPDQPLDSDVVTLELCGGFHLPEPDQPARRRPLLRGRRRRAPPDHAPAKRPAEKASEVAAAAKRKVKRIVLRTRALLRTVRQLPRFRHMQSQVEAIVAEMKAVARLARDTAHAFAVEAMRLIERSDARVRNLFMDRTHPATYPQAYLEKRRIEIRPGFTLVLYKFEFDRPDWESWLFGKVEIEIDYPNWESWLFGKPVEDEQKVA